MADNSELKKKILANADEDMIKFTESYFKNGAVHSTYLARNKMLLKAFQVQENNNLKSLNCKSTVLYAIDNVFKTSLQNIFVEHACCCNEKKENKVLNIDLNEIRYSIDQSSTCTSCGTNAMA